MVDRCVTGLESGDMQSPGKGTEQTTYVPLPTENEGVTWLAGTAGRIHILPLLAEGWGIGANIISYMLASLNKGKYRMRCNNKTLGHKTNSASPPKTRWGP